jgi:hypothetical protein
MRLLRWLLMRLLGGLCFIGWNTVAVVSGAFYA